MSEVVREAQLLVFFTERLSLELKVKLSYAEKIEFGFMTVK